VPHSEALSARSFSGNGLSQEKASLYAIRVPA
jgi:hypothetical protein